MAKAKTVESITFAQKVQGFFSNMQEKAKSGTLSEDTVEDVGMKLLTAMLDEYFLKESEISRLIGKLFENLKKSDDPLMSEVGLAERYALWAMLNLFVKNKERLTNAKARTAEEIKRAGETNPVSGPIAT